MNSGFKFLTITAGMNQITDVVISEDWEFCGGIAHLIVSHSQSFQANVIVGGCSQGGKVNVRNIAHSPKPRVCSPGDKSSHQQGLIKRLVDCVIFAGDAYKNRDPAPTFQREWGKRIMRLSKAEIPNILLVGNHDVSPSVARAHAMEEFSTLGSRVLKVILCAVDLALSDQLLYLRIKFI